MRLHGSGQHGRMGKGRALWAIAGMMGGGHRGRGHGFDGGEGDWPGRRGRGGRARVFASGELRLVLLALVAEVPRHGYELIKAVEELTGGAYAPSPGVVYPTLNLLTDEGVIAEQAGEGSRRAYSVTDTGRAELGERGEELERVLARLKAMGDDSDRQGAPPIRRAVGNLFAALRGRASSADFDKDTVHQIADILDDAARRIERL
jgi:DNA-binding PadR family transcriptional regulator